jgi:hypothetical protein
MTYEQIKRWVVMNAVVSYFKEKWGVSVSLGEWNANAGADSLEQAYVNLSILIHRKPFLREHLKTQLSK